jgi:hypothetical protein
MIGSFFRQLFCRHPAMALSGTGPALITENAVTLPGVEISCTSCGEIWHAELDASAAMTAGLAA